MLGMVEAAENLTKQLKARRGGPHPEAASYQYEERTHPDALPRFPLFSTVLNHNRSERENSLNEYGAIRM
jgi:hypothetical protein